MRPGKNGVLQGTNSYVAGWKESRSRRNQELGAMVGNGLDQKVIEACRKAVIRLPTLVAIINSCFKLGGDLEVEVGRK